MIRSNVKYCNAPRRCVQISETYPDGLNFEIDISFCRFPLLSIRALLEISLFQSIELWAIFQQSRNSFILNRPLVLPAYYQRYFGRFLEILEFAARPVCIKNKRQALIAKLNTCGFRIVFTNGRNHRKLTGANVDYQFLFSHLSYYSAIEKAPLKGSFHSSIDVLLTTVTQRIFGWNSLDMT